MRPNVSTLDGVERLALPDDYRVLLRAMGDQSSGLSVALRA
jgi:hypothetical protein